MRTIPIFFKKGRGSRWRGSGSLRRFRLDLPCLRHRLKRWGETRLAPERRSVVGFYPMAMLTSAIHLYRRLPGESIRLRPDPTTPSSPLNPRPPLIPNSEKKNLREAFAGSSLEVLPGYPGVSMRPSGRCPIWRIISPNPISPASGRKPFGKGSWRRIDLPPRSSRDGSARRRGRRHFQNQVVARREDDRRCRISPHRCFRRN